MVKSKMPQFQFSGLKSKLEVGRKAKSRKQLYFNYMLYFVSWALKLKVAFLRSGCKSRSHKLKGH